MRDPAPDSVAGAAQSYVERPAPAALSDVVASTWVQRVDGSPHVHRDLPSGSVEVRCRVGARPEVAGPLTSANVAVLEPGTTVVGLRLHPGAAGRVLPWPVSELVDQVIGTEEVWPARAQRLGEEIEAARTPAAVVECLLGAHRSRWPRTPISGDSHALRPGRRTDGCTSIDPRAPLRAVGEHAPVRRLARSQRMEAGGVSGTRIHWKEQ